MPYVKTEWIDNQTPLNAENMNHIEDGIAGLEAYVNEQIGYISSALDAINGVVV